MIPAEFVNSRARISALPRVAISPWVSTTTPVLWPNPDSLTNVPPQPSSTSSAWAPNAKASKSMAVSLPGRNPSHHEKLMVRHIDIDSLVELVDKRSAIFDQVRHDIEDPFLKTPVGEEVVEG